VKTGLPFSTLINRGGFHGLSRKKIGFKVGQKLAPLPFISTISLSLSLSLRHSSHQPKPPPASPPPAPSHVASPTTSRPPSHLKQPLFVPLSHFCKSLPLLPVNDSGHHSSQQCHPNHQLNLLITVKTPSSTCIFCNHFGCMQNVNYYSCYVNN
jgi:hypothetical protein